MIVQLVNPAAPKCHVSNLTYACFPVPVRLCSARHTALAKHQCIVYNAAHCTLVAQQHITQQRTAPVKAPVGTTLSSAHSIHVGPLQQTARTETPVAALGPPHIG